jgi:predicted GH43/DUF377 family glycosyl hydrolase
MEKQEQDYIKFKLSACLRKLIGKNQQTQLSNIKKGIEDSRVTSLRELETYSLVAYTAIQSSFTARRDPQFSSVIALVETLGYQFTDFAKIYISIKEADIRKLMEDINNARKTPQKDPYDAKVLRIAAEKDKEAEDAAKKKKNARKGKRN